MLKLCKFIWSCIKWIVLIVLCIEFFCFAAITASNLIIYGKIREGSSGVVYDPYALFLKEQGPRPTANPTAQAGARECIVWCFGGSTMRGSGKDDASTIPSQLSRALNAAQPDVRTVAVNFGENSFNSLLETKYLQKIMAEQDGNPDILLFYDGANDCVYFAQHRSPYGHHGYRRMRALIESYSDSLLGLLKPLNAAIYASFTKELYDKIMQTMVPLDPADPQLARHVELTARRYDYLAGQAQAMGARFVLFWQPVLWVETAPVRPEVAETERKSAINTDRFSVMRHNFSTVYGALETALRGKPYFVDMRNALVDRVEPVYRDDGVHLNNAGRRMMGERVAQELQERFY